MKIDPEIQQALDRLLSEQSGYTPLDLLLAQGRLLHEDYEEWRRGDVPYLEERLFGDPERVEAELEEAGRYGQALGLVAEPVDYPAWGGSMGTLNFSRSRTLQRLFHTRYARSAARPQLDLFLDSAGVGIANDLARALRGGNLDTARSKLEALIAFDPNHADIGGFERLIAARAGLEGGVAEPAALIEALERTIRPLAGLLLGGGARDFLAPFWRGLADALRGQPFDPERPKLHRAWAAAMGEEWRTVLEAVATEAETTGAPPHPQLLRLQLRAQVRLRDETGYLGAWCDLCRRDPAGAAAIAPEIPKEWRSCWEEFNQLEEELPPGDFPAWLVLRNPPLAHRLPLPQDPPTGYAQAVALAIGLPDGERIERRRALQQASPALFDAYMTLLRGG